MIINIIAGVDRLTGGIGNDGVIPWKNKDDMNWFRRHTVNNAVVMGWTTFISLGKPLKNRLNIVLTQNHDAESHYGDSGNVRTARSIDESLEIAGNAGFGIVYVIGGASIYRQFIERRLVDTIYIDKIDNETEYEYDTKFPYDAMDKTPGFWQMTQCGYSDDLRNDFIAYHNIRHERNDVDGQYLSLLNEIIHKGVCKDTRAGKTLSVFGRMLRFDMSKGLPVITTKKMYLRGCVYELLWFLRGDTNIRYLVENNVHIWDDDAYRWYLERVDSVNASPARKGEPIEPASKDAFIQMVRDEVSLYDDNTKEMYTCGDLGPVYGRQWRDWNGVDQIKRLINTLKSNPDDRRMMVSAWNVPELPRMALPPCHYMSQWYTRKMSMGERIDWYNARYGKDTRLLDWESDEDAIERFLDSKNVPSRKISMMWHQRSVDTCLGLPYNITSYGILLSMVAHVVNMVPDELVCTLGDTHVYENQMYQAEMQTCRNPYLFKCPHITLNEDVREIDRFGYGDIKIEEYESYPKLKYELSVGSPKMKTN